MSRIFKASEWSCVNGQWNVGDVSDLAHDSNAWWLPARFLGISLEEWVTKLINEFHATVTNFFPNSNNGKSLLLFHFKNYKDAHSYMLWLNRQARNKNWTIP